MSVSDLQVLFEHLPRFVENALGCFIGLDSAIFVDDGNTWGTKATKGSM
jgi:hypothetical protein